MEEKEKLYPIEELRNIQPSAPNIENEESMQFRLYKINEIHTELENEIKNRKSTYKKYKKALTTISYTETALQTSALAMGGTGLAAFTTVIGIPLALGLEIGALVVGASSLFLKLINKKISRKAKKHDEIRMVALTKLNTIQELVSKALIDSNISHEEFKLILKEREHFHTMMRDIKQQKVNSNDYEKFKKDFQNEINTLQNKINKI